MSIRQQKKKLKRNRCQSCSSTGASRNTEKNGKKNGKRHREEVYTDQHETREVQEKRIEHFKKKGDRHFTDDGRGAEITVDLVLLAKAQMSKNKFNGQEDAVVTEMIKQLLLEKIYIITKCCQERFWVRWMHQVRGRL